MGMSFFGFKKLIGLDDWMELKLIEEDDEFLITHKKSPNVAIIYKDCWDGKILSEWVGVSSNPIIHLPLYRIADIIQFLNSEPVDY